jgi:RimJ/RimL family protein N-acetyltransferase
MNYVLNTVRRRLRQLTTRDTSFLMELLNTPGWLQYIGDRNVRTEEQAGAYLQNGPLKSYREHGFGLWLVETREDGTPIGLCGILKREHLEHPDIGFAFLPAYNGKGYALEAAGATLSHAKEVFGIAKVQAIVLPANAASIRLLEKLGLTFVASFTFPDGKDELFLYSN